ncbi:FMRFamide-like neuropeptides 1 [Dirofilaria immitis]|nr:FMRFamide-like neuropeptides 1 [Dirofilaria immitis]
MFNMLSSSQQAEVRQHFGDNCDEDANEASKKLKKKTKFHSIWQRCVINNVWKKDNDPNILQFGRSSSIFTPGGQNFLRFGRAVEPNFLRFGRVIDPKFLRSGKSAEPNFLRFGKRIEVNEPNFLRLGRNNFLQTDQKYNEGFSRQNRKPNFLRFADYCTARSSAKDVPDDMGMQILKILVWSQGRPPAELRKLECRKLLIVPIATRPLLGSFRELTGMDLMEVASKSDMYVYLLPFTVRKQLAAILDADNA